MNIGYMQSEVDLWVEYNFGHGNEMATVCGLTEESTELLEAVGGLLAAQGVIRSTGLLNRAAVKRSQGIRGTDEQWMTEIRKEAADVFIKLCDVASFYGFDLESAIEERWKTVSLRDHVADPAQARENET